MSYVDPHFRRMPRPGANRHGRRVTRRDKLIAIAFGALLLFGLWWMVFRQTGYTVSTVDLSGVLYYTEEIGEDTHNEFYGQFGQGQVIVVVGIGNEFQATTDRSRVLLAQMLLAGEYPDATMKRFSNAVVICGIPDDCSSLARRVEANARERESRWVATTD